MYGYSQGCTRNDVNRIREMNAAGKTVDEISRALLVVPTCIQSFVDSFKPKKKRAKAYPPVRAKVEPQLEKNHDEQ